MHQRTLGGLLLKAVRLAEREIDAGRAVHPIGDEVLGAVGIADAGIGHDLDPQIFVRMFFTWAICWPKSARTAARPATSPGLMSYHTTSLSQVPTTPSKVCAAAMSFSILRMIASSLAAAFSLEAKSPDHCGTLASGAGRYLRPLALEVIAECFDGLGKSGERHGITSFVDDINLSVPPEGHRRSVWIATILFGNRSVALFCEQLGTNKAFPGVE
jgi:hypothetical protein